jgi:hypothetical protein
VRSGRDWNSSELRHQFSESHLPGAINIPLTQVGGASTAQLQSQQRTVVILTCNETWALEPLLERE